LEKISHDNLSDVEINDFFQELKVLQMTLPNSLMSALEILEFVVVAIPDHGLPDPINPDPPEKTPTRPNLTLRWVGRGPKFSPELQK
jgi:hypothetical protein